MSWRAVSKHGNGLIETERSISQKKQTVRLELLERPTRFTEYLLG